jgi:glutathione synthase/RimK-type ligase-like ATP-grasp enzyme
LPSTGSKVLVVAPAGDDHAWAVRAALRRRGVPVALLDTNRFPERASLAAALGPGRGAGWTGALNAGRRERIEASEVGAVWHWRPEPYRVDAQFVGPRRAGAFCAAEAALRAFWAALDAAWVNDRASDAAADDKPRQLALAAGLGLAVPLSLVTNDPAAARAFVRSRADGETIHKNVTSAPALWRTTVLARHGDRALFASVRHLPLLFQERVRAEADVRLTVVGDELFATEITLPTRTRSTSGRPCSAPAFAP